MQLCPAAKPKLVLSSCSSRQPQRGKQAGPPAKSINALGHSCWLSQVAVHDVGNITG